MGWSAGLRATALCLVATVLSVRAAGPQAADLHGTARTGAGPAPDSVVWLDAPKTPAVAAHKAVLDQRNLNFSPHVLAVRVGTTVDFPNNDRVFHNVFSFKDGKRFDLGMYPVGALKRVTFGQPGLSRVFCNIHPNMAAYVLAVDSPYFAVSDDDGTFTIASVPPGTYTYHAWRAGTTDVTGTWTSTAGQPLTVSWP
jgi:plastocyanin